MSPAVLIVGAGPTGLVLALRLQAHGVPFRIIDSHAGPGEASRALIVHARTLEFYAQLGLAERLIEAGTKVEAVRMREGGADVGVFSLRDMGEGQSPFPFALCLPQDEHERLLVAALEERGATVEWNTALERLEQGPDTVAVTLAHGGREEHSSCAYLAGCDGARSLVRGAIGAQFEGGTYDRLYYVADVKPRTAPGANLVVALDRGDFALMLPARKGENERVIGFVPEGRERDAGFDDIRPDAERLLGLEVDAVHWFSTYQVHHRVATRFRNGRCFLLGDAGHVHSPVGGQGMNTGIGDAVNLGWKLAAVVAGRGPATLLDTYEPERIAFARSLVATTDRGFQWITDEGLTGRLFRTWILPHAVPAATRFDAGRHAIFRVLSQIRIAYPDSALSVGTAGGVAGGDRLPWVPSADNFAPLVQLRWQLHGFGELDARVVESAEALDVPVHRFAWSSDAERVGFRCGSTYLVRPDGHVGLALDHPDTPRLEAYAEQVGLRRSTQTRG